MTQKELIVKMVTEGHSSNDLEKDNNKLVMMRVGHKLVHVDYCYFDEKDQVMVLGSSKTINKEY